MGLREVNEPVEGPLDLRLLARCEVGVERLDLVPL
jgi:hypothetical protein